MKVYWPEFRFHWSEYGRGWFLDDPLVGILLCASCGQWFPSTRCCYHIHAVQVDREWRPVP